MLPGALLGRPRTLAVVKEGGVEKSLIGISRLPDETPRGIPTCSLSPSGLFDLFSPSLQEVVMLLLGYSACLLIVQYSALLARASGMPLGQATRSSTTAWVGRMAPLPPSQSLSSTCHRVPLRGIFPRYPAWACRAVGSARDDRLYPPDGRLANLRQRLRDPRRTRRRWFLRR